MTIEKEIIQMLDAFMANSYLVPSTHTDYLCFTDTDEEYRTYANADRDYFSYEIRKDGKRTLSGVASRHSGKWSIPDDLLASKTSGERLKIHYTYIKAIYNEVHSLNVDKTRVKELRAKILKEQEKIKSAQKQISILKQEISDSKLLTK